MTHGHVDPPLREGVKREDPTFSKETVDAYLVHRCWALTVPLMHGRTYIADFARTMLRYWQ